MIVVGITGGIASGKSHILNKVKSMGAYVLDCDAVAKELSLVGNPLHRAVADGFGEAYLNDDGSINKRKLRETVFSHKDSMDKLNKISAGIIKEDIIKRLKNIPENEIVFVEGVRVFEETFADLFDRIWFVYCDKDEQLRRLIARDGLSKESAEKILNSQQGILENMNKADVVINTNGSIDDLMKRVEEIYEEMKTGLKKSGK